MHESDSRTRPGFVEIGKTRTHIWEEIGQVHARPFVIYDPNSRPQLRSTSSPRSTSNYDMHEANKSSGGKFRLVPAWLMPRLDERYCELIYQHLKEFDQVFLVGAGIGKWSGVNNFINYVNKSHPHFSTKIWYQRYIRLTDFSEDELLKIFADMSANYS